MALNDAARSTQAHPSTETATCQINYKIQIVWFNVMTFTLLHAGFIYGNYLVFTSARLYTSLFAGAHRLWAHRAYRATWQLRVLLMILNCIAFQNTIIEWARDHRVHHKYTETNADPHNANRGFFFAHIFWLLCKKHPDVIKKGKGVNMDDLKQDPILRFQEKYYLCLVLLWCFILPTLIPILMWNETPSNALFIATIVRYVYSLNATWLVNSAAHMFGSKPYDKFINPSENKVVSVFALGEGWHNYHHAFPWDYKTAELGNYQYNVTTAFIDFFAWFGRAYDLKNVSTHLVKKSEEYRRRFTLSLGWCSPESASISAKRCDSSVP